MIGQLEGAARDLSALLETARESVGDRLRCKNCGAADVQRLLMQAVKATVEAATVIPIQVIVAAGGPIDAHLGG